MSHADLRFPITGSSQVGEARRLVSEAARGLGFDETGIGKAAIVVTEAATNILKHASEGELVVREMQHDGVPGIEILVLDRGPGISNVEASLRNGHSTAGTPGTGLGAMARLSGTIELHSPPGAGTAILMRLFPSPPGARRPGRLEIGGVCLAKPGQEVCGDGWEAHQTLERSLLLVADGLGHGPDAHHASREAARIFAENVDRGPAEIIGVAHDALRSTRGAVLGVAEINFQCRVVRYSGVGNIAGAIVGEESVRHLVSLNGTVGRDVRKVQEFAYPLPEGALLVLHSDGLSSRWALSPSLAARHPSLIAGVLYRDHHRENDDVTVLVAKERGMAGPA